MNNKSAVEFINSVVRNLQVLCHSNVDFSEDVEVIGHIYLSVDKSKKFNYILNEKVCKSDNSSTVFVSNSFHADQNEKTDSDSAKQSNKAKPSPSTGPSTDERLRFPIPPKQNIPSKRLPTSEIRQTPLIGDKNIFQDNRFKLSDKARHLQRDNSHNKYDEPFKKFRKIEENSSETFDVVKQESFTAEPVFLQPSTSTKDLSEFSRQSFHTDQSSITSQSIRESSDYNEFDNSPNQIDLTNIKEEPIDVFHENSRGLNNILHQVEMQQNQFSESHNTSMENLQQLSNSVTTYGDVSPTTAHQQQQILSLFQGKRRPNSSYKTLSLADKVKLITAAESNENLSQMKISKMFGISQKSVCNILKLKDKYIEEWNALSNDGPEVEIIDQP
ncbi:uncharacterized protein LOC126816064 isoform X2 [Patella vulgata]|uniref:uncharacterized protein LOC126816064 isoform X2 n=1 Tax=Patella vulgata TaxID=6465 RepID=UPI0021806D33|nr:uncharacterized protein LOC126816064 isoform X2 [Patella vulgata]